MYFNIETSMACLIELETRLAKNGATRRWSPFVLAQLIFNSIFNVDKMLHDVARTTCHTAHGSWQLAGGRWSSKWQFVKIFAININYAHKVKSLAAFRLIINALGAKQKRREKERGGRGCVETDSARLQLVCGMQQQHWGASLCCASERCRWHFNCANSNVFVGI